MRRRLQAAIVALAMIAGAGATRANPLSLARFGGLRGDAVYSGAYALYWNPAALAAPGFDVAVDAQLIARQASYDRDAALNAVPDASVTANAGLATISTVGVVPSAMARWGRALRGFDVGVGFGAFVENGGTASWDKNLRAPPGFAGAIDGPQRWASINAQLVLVDLGLGLAARHRRAGLAVGFTPILVELGATDSLREDSTIARCGDPTVVASSASPSTRDAWRRASSCAIKPPIEIPTTNALAAPAASSTAATSSAMCGTR